MINYKAEYIQINLEGTMLKCNLIFPEGIDCPVIAYGLLDKGINKTIIEYTSEYSHQFRIKRNGKYQIRVYYKNEIPGEKSKSFISRIIDVLLDIPMIHEVKNSVNIFNSKNKIVFDFSNALFSEALDVDISVGATKVNRKIKSNLFSYAIAESGLHKLKLSYKDYAGNLCFFEHDIYVELETNILDPNNVKLNKNARLIFYILYAFVFREFQRKYDKGYFRYFSIILGPAVQLGILVLIFTLLGRKTVVGLSIPLFILTGLLPYNFFTSAGNCLTIVSANRALLSYKQVKIIDIILSSVLMDFLVISTVFFCGLLVCYYFGMKTTIYNPLSLIFAFIILFILTFGFGMILSVIGFYFAEFNYAIQIVFRALFYISGVFFSIENIPVQYQKYLLWNPLLQLIEFIRFSFVSFNLPHELSYIYLLKCILIIFLFGVSLYFINRNKFMVNDRAR